MQLTLVATLLASVTVHSALGAPTVVERDSLKVLVGNDDGWAEANVRAFYQTLSAAGYNTVVSAPVENQSGTGSSDSAAKVLTKAGQYNTVPVGAPAEGSNSTDSRLNYVNSYPVTAIKYGITTLAPKFFGGAPDIVVTGPNVGNNLGVATFFSGTVGAASEAAKQNFPAIAFSGDNSPARSYTTLVPGDSSFLYAQIAQKLVATLTATSKPWLPSGVALNVNFPAVSSTCSKLSDFQFVLTRLYWNPLRDDVVTCNNGGHLPDETPTKNTSGKCYVTVSAFDANNKRDASIAEQAVVLSKLSSILVCKA
ncbi:5'/3'-nucleotidase SurE family protein [Rhizoctonia solani AG-3 Rhs1AP]|uniref:5'/3'-nucleotidase SurE family protein n=2 Tax=Rhizoctonia solani AG-3 TaxID=1086053 RepID=A0A074SS22_9AGAM|nr:5'/3'-nucleotidase SurE family protein [Rhizoctonia solani AG-3 Rhs1AP]KEP52742.1 5'/3'-nucleotidase SurE family protein [Rhizoctonia solani 123E]